MPKICRLFSSLMARLTLRKGKAGRRRLFAHRAQPEMPFAVKAIEEFASVMALQEIAITTAGPPPTQS